MQTEQSIALFEQKEVRKVRYNDQWYFSLDDIVLILAQTTDVRQYIKKMKKRDEILNVNWGTICTPLALVAKDGKIRKILCSNTAWILRIIQSIPSPKAEPFKQRLAQVWYERIQEINDPELAQERMKKFYEAKGYSKERIDKRLRGISVRQTLTDERKERWIQKGNEYSILTAEISKATFGMTPGEYLKHKWLDHQNLRDHMTDLELIFTMLGEASTTAITQNKNAVWFDECAIASREGGKIAGDARKNLEMKSGKSVVSSENYLVEQEKLKRIRKR